MVQSIVYRCGIHSFKILRITVWCIMITNIFQLSEFMENAFSKNIDQP